MITFIISLFSIIPTVNAYQSLRSVTLEALNNLDNYLTMDIEDTTDGSSISAVINPNRAHYCLEPNETDSGYGGNGSNMNTFVIDVGKDGIDSVNGLSAADSEAARRAMEVAYYATNGYITNSLANQLMMQYRICLYGPKLLEEGLIGTHLDNAVPYEITNKVTDWRRRQEEALEYVNMAASSAFKDRSTPDIQTIEEVGDWIFIGPYKIENRGGSITDITVENAKGETFHPDGWATAPDENTITYNNDLPDSTEFYLAFNQQKPDGAEKVTVSKNYERVLRARLVVFGSNGGQNLITYGGRFEESSGMTTISLPKVTYSSLKLRKIDAETKEPLNGIGFIVYNETEGKWVKEGTPAQYVEKAEATPYLTEADGTITIRNLSKTGNYKIYEVINPYDTYREVGFEDDKMMLVNETPIRAIGQSIDISDIENEKVFGKLRIKKVDQTTGKSLGAGIGFTIKMTSGEKAGQYVKKGADNKATYSNTPSTIYTDSKGEIYIEKLWKGEYEIQEVINPYFGYEETPKKFPPITITAGDTAKEEKLTNLRKYVKLSGYVWEDLAYTGKEKEEENDLYYQDEEDKNDKRLKNVTVTLRKANGEIIDQKVTNTIKNTKDKQEEGAYLFGDYLRNPKDKKILIEDLRGAYIEFEYNGMCYKSVPLHINVNNGSKAADDNLREAFNKKYGTIVQGKAIGGEKDLQLQYQYQNDSDIGRRIATLVYGGNYKYGYDGQKYPIAGINGQYLIKANTKDGAPNHLLGQTAYTINDIYEKRIEEIPNINLGLKERKMPDLSLVQDVDNVQISLNNYTHTYYYANRLSTINKEIEEYLKNHPDDENVFNVGVNFEKPNEEGYTRTVYSSDVVYNEKEGNEKLQIYVTYKIKLTNESYAVNSVVNQIYNYYDKDYEIVSVRKDGKDITYNKDLNYQGNNQYKRLIIEPQGGVQLRKNTKQEIEITYKVNKDVIVGLLNQDKTLNSISEITSYSSYDDDNFEKRYAGVDKDSAPNNATLEDKKTYEDDTSRAPSMKLTSDATRSIEGTVWEENAIEGLLEKIGYEKHRIGNGQYDETLENVIKDVKVELLKIKTDEKGKVLTDENGNLSFETTKLYQTKGEGKNRTGIIIIGKDENKNEEQGGAVSKSTDNKGHYKFEGIIPGEYVIRFTYQNTSILCDSNGKELKTLEEAEGGVEYYKSTSFRTQRNEKGTVIKEYDEGIGTKWYAIDTRSPERLSDAKDDWKDVVEYRTTVEEINYNNATQEASRRNEISADTNQITIDMDCNEDDINNISKFGQRLKYKFNNVDFGIIRRPKQNLKVKKEIAYVEVVLANGQTIIKGDPRNEKIPYLQFLDNGTIHIELDNEIIQGATLKLDYEITVDNRGCEIDYNNKDYYYFGKVPEGKKGWKIATVKELFDYPNNGLNFEKTEEINENWEYVVNAGTINNSEILENLIENGKLSGDLKDVLKQYNNILCTTEFKDMEPGQTKSVPIKFSKLLSNTNDELAYANDVEINTYEGRKIDYTTPGNYNPADSETSEADNATVNTIITGPTGGSKNYLPYILLGITSLGIVAAGIILIKKIVK